MDTSEHSPLAAGGDGRRAEGGWALIETALAGTVLAVALLTVASALGSSVTTTSMAKQMNAAGRFLEETMSSLDAQDYDNLPALHGNAFFDQTDPAAARFRIDLSVRDAAIDMLELRAILREQRSGREISRVATYRSRR